MKNAARSARDLAELYNVGHISNIFLPLLPSATIKSTTTLGLCPMQLEACNMAHMQHAINFKEVAQTIPFFIIIIIFRPQLLGFV